MLHLFSILFFLFAAAFGLTVITITLSENSRRIRDALLGAAMSARAAQPRIVAPRARLIRA